MAVKKYKRGAKEQLSANFISREFDCGGKGCCSQTCVDEKLVAYLQKIRDHFHKPVTVNSGYRCKTHNARVPNAAPNSYHMKGKAADIKIKGVSPKEICAYAELLGVLGIGCYDTFTHIDTRTKKFFWYGHAAAKRTTFLSGPYTRQMFLTQLQNILNTENILEKTPTISAVKNPKHPVVAPVQRYLYQLGYTQVGTADGIAGRRFTEAVQAYQKDHNCWVDGEITAKNKTWKSLLEEEK